MSTRRSDKCICKFHPHCNEMRLREKFCDVVLKVEDRKFPCHRVILASAMEYFQIMFSGHFMEAGQKEVELKGIRADDFELLLKHIYGESVRIDEHNVFRLLRFSNYLGSDTFIDSCRKYLLKNRYEMSLTTALNIFLYADEVKLTAIVDVLKDLLITEFLVLRLNERYVRRISRAHVVETFGTFDNVEPHRISCIDFITRWTRHHPAEVDVVDELLLKLKLSSEWHEWCSKNIKCEASVVLNNRINDGGAPEGRKSGFSYDGGLAGLSKIKYPTVSVYTRLGYNRIQMSKYNTRSSENVAGGRLLLHDVGLSWTRFFKSVFVGDTQFLFVSTGKRLTSESSYRISPYVYSASTKKMKALESRQSSAIESSSDLAVCGTNVYLYSGDEFLMFNGEVNQWTQLKNLPLRTKNGNVISYENNLYLLGGQCVENGAKTSEIASTSSKKIHVSDSGRIFQRYDPREGAWSRLPTMTHGRSSFSSCVYKDVLYAVGAGDDSSFHRDSIECYDFRTSKWRVLDTKMPVSKKTPIVLGYHDQLFLFGRDDDFSSCSYDLLEDEWSNVLPIPWTQGSGTKRCRILDVELKVDSFTPMYVY